MYSDKAVSLIKALESLRLKAYKPTADDVWTIGYGHTRGVRQGDECTWEQAEQWLREDMDLFAKNLNSWVRTPLTRNQYDALLSLVFNVGHPQTLIKCINLGLYDQAADEFDRWVYQNGRALYGLCRRRAEEKLLFLRPDNDTRESSLADIEVLAQKIWSKVPEHKRAERRA